MKETLRKDFFKYVSLNIMGMLGLSCYILADTYFVSAKLGADGLTSLNLAISIYSFIHGTGLMIGIGGATRYAICRMKKEYEKCNAIFTTAVIVGIIIGVCLTVFGIFGAEMLAGLLGAKGEILGVTTTYLRTILCFSPCFILNNIMIAFIRNDGNPRLSMTGMLAGSFANIVLDYIFMFPLDMGIFGAAFATGLAPVISLIVLASHKIKGKNQFHFRMEKAMHILRNAKDIGAIGIAAFINEVSSGLVLVIFNLLIIGLTGNIGVAAYGIVANLALVAMSIFTGIAQGSQPLISKYYGKGQKEAVRTIYRYSIILAAAIGVGLVAIGFGCTDFLIGVFNSEGSRELRDIAFVGLRLYFLGFLFVGVNIVTASYMGAVERAKGSFIIAITRGFFAILFFAVLLSNLFGMTGVWMAFLCAELLTLGVSFYSLK